MKNLLTLKTGERIIRWIVAPALVLSLAGLVGSNILLQTRPVRGWVEKKLAKRSGFVWRVSGLSWTPWSGVRLGSVRAEWKAGREEGFEPAYSIREIVVQPYWRDLLRGQLKVREIRVVGMRAAFPLELLALAPGREVPPPRESPGVPPEKPAKDQADPEAGDGKQSKDPGGEERPEKGAGSGAEKDVPRPGANPPAGGGSKGGAPARVVKAGAKKHFETTLILEDCALSIYSKSGGIERRLEVLGIEGEVPVGGEEATGRLSIRGVALAGEPVADPLGMTLEWRRPVLRVPLTVFEWEGLKIRAGGSLRVGGAPLCNAEVRILPGELEPIAVQGWEGVTVGAGRVEMLGRFAGNLQDPGSWKGDAVAEIRDLEVEQQDRGGKREFEIGRIVSVMRGGVMQVVDARLVSESLSLLGNGVVLGDGRVIGVMRLVADQESAAAITKVAVGSFLSGGWTRSWLEPLETPDRLYRDVRLSGTLENATVDVGKKREELKVDLAWQRMVSFVKQEAQEERVAEKRSIRENQMLLQK